MLLKKFNEADALLQLQAIRLLRNYAPLLTIIKVLTYSNPQIKVYENRTVHFIDERNIVTTIKNAALKN